MPCADAVTNSIQQGHANNDLPEPMPSCEPAPPSAAVSGLPESQPAVEPVAALPTQPEKEVWSQLMQKLMCVSRLRVTVTGCTSSTLHVCVKVRRSAAGKRKAAEVAEAVQEAVPDAGPADNLGIAGPAGNGLEVTSTDNSPEAASAETGPMTKAKKRKGVSQSLGCLGSHSPLSFSFNHSQVC